MRSAFGRLDERRVFFGARARYLYELIGWVFRNDTDLCFMNYGYADGRLERDLALPGAAEAERYSAQLYHAVASQVTLAGKRVLDVGCGRGGGAAHIQRWLGPRETVGCDITHQAIAFCRRVHGRRAGLSFVQADAAALPFADAAFDAVTNVESSHCYADRGAFFRQAHRVLRPGGAFLYADFTPPRHDPGEVLAAIALDLAEAGFGEIELTDITPEILRGLDADDARRRHEIGRRFPFGTRRFARLWAGTSDSWIYRDFTLGRRAYFMVNARALALRPLPPSLAVAPVPQAETGETVIA